MIEDYYSPLGGHPYSIQLPTPAPGNEIGYNIPARRNIIPLSIEFDFTADGNAATRELQFAFSVGGAQIYPFQFYRGITAGQTVHVALSANFGHVMPADRNNQIFGALPWPIFLYGGSLIYTTTVNMQVGDQFQSITLNAREFLDATY